MTKVEGDGWRVQETPREDHGRDDTAKYSGS
jgi:hypothetical protein